jgi:hypothetical protein
MTGEVASFAARCTRSYYEYRSALCQVEMEMARRQREAGDRCTETSDTAQKAAFKPARDAYFEYLKTFQAAHIHPQPTGLADVYRAQNHYLEIHQQACNVARRGIEEARLAYAKTFEQIQKETLEAQRAAYERYLRALKDAWTESDLKAIDARALSTCGQSIAAVAASLIQGGPVIWSQ